MTTKFMLATYDLSAMQMSESKNTVGYVVLKQVDNFPPQAYCRRYNLAGTVTRSGAWTFGVASGGNWLDNVYSPSIYLTIYETDNPENLLVELFKYKHLEELAQSFLQTEV